MANLTTTDLDNGKTDLETLSTVVNSQTESTTSTRLGDTVKTIKGLTDEFEQAIATGESDFEQAIINSGYQVLGSFASGVTITAVNQVLDYDGGLYRTTEALPYTTDGATPDLDSGVWVVVSDGVLSGIARSLSVLDSEVIYSTDTATVIDDVLYIYDAINQVTWGKPSDVGVGETIVSVVGDVLTTSGGTYNLYQSKDKGPADYGWLTTGGEDNYNILEQYVKSDQPKKTYNSLYTIGYFYTQWAAGNSFPLAFYGDSTTDGFSTVGHVSSYIEGGNANVWSNSVVVTESPNAYPAKLKENILGVVGSSAPVQIYNAGFDSMSLSNDFGNKAFHRVFFGYPSLNNVDFSDVKGVVLAWGTSDSANLDDINSVLDSYEWKMELLIIECYERGIQPFISNPVYNNQRVGSLADGRNNFESVSVIEEINKRLATKYDLEILSLRDPIETYIANAYPNLDNTIVPGSRGDFGEMVKVLPDGVHPTDKGHRMIASYFASRMCPLIKLLKGCETYKFTAGSVWPITSKDFDNDDILGLVDDSLLITRSTYFHKYSTTAASSNCYTLMIYCEKPMDLTYSMLAVAGKSRDTDNYPRIDISNSVENYSKFRPSESDYLSANFSSQSHQLIGRLDVGLNTVSVTSAQISINSNLFGFLQAEPLYEANKVEYDYQESGLTRFVNRYPDIQIPSAGLFEQWSIKRLSRESYALGGRNSNARRITFEANTLHQRDIMFNAARNFVDFDTYDVMRCSGTSVQLYNVTSSQLGTPSETLVGSVTSSFDFSSDTDNTFSINIQTTDSATIVYLQRVNKTSGVIDNIAGPISMTTDSISSGGYSFGVKKSIADTLPTVIRNITDEFVH